jgi:hypothetical protein
MRAARLLRRTLGLFALASCSPVVEANFEDIQVTRPDIPVPPATAGAFSMVTFQFTLDSGRLGANTNPEAQDQIKEVLLHGLSLTAKSGISDLSFVRSLRIFAYVPLRTTSSSEPVRASRREVEIADYERRSDTPVGPTLTVPLSEDVDLSDLVKPDSTQQTKIVVVTNLGGQLPTVSWKVDVTMALTFRLEQ